MVRGDHAAVGVVQRWKKERCPVCGMRLTVQSSKLTGPTAASECGRDCEERRRRRREVRRGGDNAAAAATGVGEHVKGKRAARQQEQSVVVSGGVVGACLECP